MRQVTSIMTQEKAMSEDNFNLSMRKFLKSVGVTSQQKIEEAVRAIESSSDLSSIDLTVTLTCKEIDLNHEVKGTIDLP
jgi:hypothetical protein